MSSTAPTCQICARVIKAKSGVIAHHGYKMPHGRAASWRTASCMGTRYRPYEVSADRIPFVIQVVENCLERDQTALEALRTNPPDILKITLERYRKAPETLEVQRPEGFTLERPASFTINSYKSAFWGRHRNLEVAIAGGRNDLKYFRDRLAAWVAPAEGGNDGK